MTKLLGPKGWAALLAASLTVVVLIPLLNLVVPAGSVFHLSDFYVSLIGKILINENGELIATFSPRTAPMSEDILKHLN